MTLPRIAVLGSVIFTKGCVAALEKAGCLVGVMTLGEKAGRERHSDYAEIRPKKAPYTNLEAKGAIADALAVWQPDHLFVLGWSRLIDDDTRMRVPGLCIGSHPSPLPRGRGRSPLLWAHLLNWKWTALSFFCLTGGEPDSGPIVWQKQFYIGADIRESYGRMCVLGARAVVEIAHGIGDGTLQLREQTHSLATTFPKRERETSDVWLPYMDDR